MPANHNNGRFRCSSKDDGSFSVVRIDGGSDPCSDDDVVFIAQAAAEHEQTFGLGTAVGDEVDEGAITDPAVMFQVVRAMFGGDD